MRNTMTVGILISAMAAGSPLFAQASSDEVAQLKQRVDRLEKQVQEMSQLLEPVKAQQAMESRRNALHQKFEKKAAQDRAKYTPAQLQEAEGLYQVANQKWGSPEAAESLRKMIQQYPDVNRTGCAVLYLAQSSKDAERAKYLRDCMEKYNDCFYGDGVQVGAFARFLLAQDYRSKGDAASAQALETELKTHYAGAIDHGGKLLVDGLKAESE